jgi:hypothetical protein
MIYLERRHQVPRDSLSKIHLSDLHLTTNSFINVKLLDIQKRALQPDRS